MQTHGGSCKTWDSLETSDTSESWRLFTYRLRLSLSWMAAEEISSELIQDDIHDVALSRKLTGCLWRCFLESDEMNEMIHPWSIWGIGLGCVFSSAAWLFFFFIVFFLLCSAIKMHGRVQKKHNNSQMFLLCCVLKIAQEHSRYLYLYCARWQGCFKVENSQDKNKKIEFNSCTCVIYIWVE